MTTSNPIDFDLSHTLARHGGAPSYACDVSVDFDGAEGAAVWINSDDESIAIRGPKAMRELAMMLLAFAEGYDALEREAINDQI